MVWFRRWTVPRAVCLVGLAVAPLAPTPTSAQAPAEVEATAPDARDADDADDAGDAAAVEDTSLEELLGLELRDTLGQTDAASRATEDVLDAPATVTVLTHEDIVRSGARTIPDLLRYVPGVQVQQVAPGSYLVAIRGAGGLTGNNVVVMVDGVPINSPLDGSVEWSSIPFDLPDIQSIEVVRGPVSTVHGANAFTGVVQIRSFQGLGDARQGAARVRVGVTDDGAFDGVASARYVRRARGFEQAYFLTARHEGNGRQGAGVEQPPALGASLGTRLALNLDGGHRIALVLSGAFLQRSSLEHLVLESLDEQRITAQGELRYTLQRDEGVFAEATVYARGRLAHVDAVSDAFVGFSYDDTLALSQRTGAELQLRLGPYVRAFVGAELALEHVSAPYLHPQASGRTRVGYAGSVRLRWDPSARLTFEGAVRGDVPAITGELTPSFRLSASYHTDSMALRVSGARAFRAPTYVERGGSFVDPNSGLILLEGSSDVANPTVDGAEVYVAASLGNGVDFSGAAYFQRFSGLVVEDFAPLARKTFVTDPDDHYAVGAELTGRYRVSDELQFVLALSVLSLLERGHEDASVEPLSAVPDQNSRFTGSLRALGGGFADRFHYGAGVQLATGREFAVRAGIPPAILNADIGLRVHVQAMAEVQPSLALPLWISLRATGMLTPGAESPLPGAGRPGASFMVGLAYRSL
ncbi:MAG: TonB-dependent receptor [Polyangiales bacterium]|nr:TonB-dependent receptor [Myxococcales bacterium]MCB9656308.1 TonB-dependent receptor [Sandaracinaceae bacterium]